MSSTNSEVLWWGRMISQISTHSSFIAKNQRTSHKSLGPARSSYPRSSAEVCNFTLQRQTTGQKENVWPTLAFVLISLSNVQTLLPLGYLKWCGEDSQPHLSSPRQTHHQNTTIGGGKRLSEAEGESDGNGADVCVAVDLWPDKGATQAAGIDGLLVRTGPSVSCFQNDWFTIKWLRVCACRQNWCRSIPLKLIDQPFSLAVCLPNENQAGLSSRHLSPHKAKEKCHLWACLIALVAAAKTSHIRIWTIKV